MKAPKYLPVLIAAALAYQLGLVFAVGFAARLVPAPSPNAVVATAAYALAVVVVAAFVAAVLVARFANKTFAAGLLVATPFTLHLLRLLSQSSGAFKMPLVAIKDTPLITLTPAAMGVVISHVSRVEATAARREGGSAK